MTVFQTLSSLSGSPTSQVAAHKAYLSWQEEQDKKNVWFFLERGWLDEAVEIITKPHGTGWKIVSASRDLDSIGLSTVAISLLHAWAMAPEHVNDRTFLERWQAEFGDVTGDAVLNLHKSYHVGPTKDGVVRLAISRRRWNKAEMLLEMGAPWLNAHADVFMGVAGLSYVRSDSLEIAKTLLQLPNVKEWINTPIRGRGYGMPTALSCALESESDEAKEIVPLLIGAGADINAPLYEGNTILHMVMGAHGREPYKALAKRIVKLGGDLSKPNDAGITPVGAWLQRREHRDWSMQKRSEMEREWLMLQTLQKAPDLKAKKNPTFAL